MTRREIRVFSSLEKGEQGETYRLPTERRNESRREITKPKSRLEGRDTGLGTDSKGKKGKDEEGSHFGLSRSQSQMEIIRDEEIIIQRGEYSRFFCSSKSQSNCSVFHEKLI